MKIDWATFAKSLVFVVAGAIVLSAMHFGSFLDSLGGLLPHWGAK